MRGPRIGRPDRLAQLEQELKGRATTPWEWGRPRPALSVPAVTQLLAAPPPPADPPEPTRQAIADRAGQLAALLELLPSALHELGVRISRHCGATQRDAELARLVDLVRARTFDLFLAIRALRDAGGVRCLAGPLALLLLAGCALTRPALKPDATVAERERAEVCHTRAVAWAEESTAFKTAPEAPAKGWQWWEVTLAPVLLVGAAVEVAAIGVVAIATAPWMLASEHNRRKADYQRIYTACMGEPQAAVDRAEPAEKETTP